MTKISETLDIHILDNLQLQTLWVFDHLSDDAQNRFSPSDIANFLIETCSISTSRQAITYVIEKGGNFFHKNSTGYKLMEPGRKKLLEQTMNNKVIFIESGKPFLAKNIIIKNIFDSLIGEILICDPYIDVNTLDIIYKNCGKKKNVKILTKNIIDKPTGSFARDLANLRSEGYQIEIGIYTNSEMHDRYIIDDQAFWLSGNSLNYLGNKESFIIRLGNDIRQSMLATFNNRWKVSIKQ